MQTWQIRNAADFGTAVRKARTEQHLTQRQLALSVGAGERFPFVNLENGKETARLGDPFQSRTFLCISTTMTYED